MKPLFLFNVGVELGQLLLGLEEGLQQPAGDAVEAEVVEQQAHKVEAEAVPEQEQLSKW